MRNTIVACALATASAAVPAFPLQFVATVETTAHRRTSPSRTPPWKNASDSLLDYLNPRADVLEGLDAGKNFLPAYDTKQLRPRAAPLFM